MLILKKKSVTTEEIGGSVRGKITKENPEIVPRKTFRVISAEIAGNSSIGLLKHFLEQILIKMS